MVGLVVLCINIGGVVKIGDILFICLIKNILNLMNDVIVLFIKVFSDYVSGGFLIWENKGGIYLWDLLCYVMVFFGLV